MMDNFNRLRLSPYYLNTRRLSEISGIDIPIAAQRTLNQNSNDRAEGFRLASRLADEILKGGKIPNLAHVFGSLGPEEAIIASLWGVFTFRGVADSLDRERKGKPKKPATFSADIPLGEEIYRLSGELSNDHIYSDTSISILSNKRRLLMVGRFELSGDSVEVHPYVIGDVVDDLGIGLPVSWGQRVRVYPQMISNFAKMEHQSATPAEMKRLLSIPEERIKHAFAEIIGEPYVPHDWGGERSDLQTSRLRIDNDPLSAAFIFKGPSVRGELHPNNMGKRGDQLIRAFDEPADLIVIQHCNKIANTVVRLAEALAMNLNRTRRYCIIDGNDTVRILKAYGKFPPNIAISGSVHGSRIRQDRTSNET